MACGVFSTVRRLAALGCLAGTILFWPGAADRTARAADADGLAPRLEALSDEDLDALIDFVDGNVLFTLYHEAGHMLVSELDLPVLGQEEDAVDALATLAMLQSGNTEMDHLLSQAMLGWFLGMSDDAEDLVFHEQHDLDPQRGYSVLCLMVGSDRSAFRDLAVNLDLPKERMETCTEDYEQAVASWDRVTEPYLRVKGELYDPVIAVRHETVSGDLKIFADFLRESEVMELVAEEMDDLYRLPNPVTFQSESCGTANAYWDPQARELTICHELLAAFAQIYLDEVLDDGK
jgi:hypothetical protein